MAINFNEFSVNSSEEQARSLAAVLGEVGGESGNNCHGNTCTQHS